MQSGKPGRRVPNARSGTARAARQLPARAEVGDLGRVRRLEAEGVDHVRADDRRLVDLHRSPGNPAGHVPALAAAAEEHFGTPTSPAAPSFTAGLGGMGGAQPLAATMAGAAILCVEIDPTRIERRLETLSSTRWRGSRWTTGSSGCVPRRGERRPLSVGLLGNAGRDLPRARFRRGEVFDLVTDQTAAHDPLVGYVPAEVPIEEAEQLRSPRPPSGYLELAFAVVDRSPTARQWSTSSASDATFSIMATTCAVRPVRVGSTGFRLSRIRAGLHPTTLLRRRRSVSMGCALRRPRRHPQRTGRS